MESVLGNWLPVPQGAADCPSPPRAQFWSTSRWARCQALREVAHPPPGRTSSSPPPAPAEAAVHTLYLLLFSLCVPPLSLGRACRLAAWQEPAVSLAGPSITPYLCPNSLCPGRPLKDLGLAQAAPRPPASASRSWGPAAQHPPTPPPQGCTPARVEVRARPAHGGEEWPQERPELWVGLLQGEDNYTELPLQAH